MCRRSVSLSLVVELRRSKYIFASLSCRLYSQQEHILLFFTEHLEFFQFFSIFFVFFSVFFGLFRFYTETESFDVSIEPKQTENPPNQFKREYIWVFFKKFRVVSVLFGLLQNRSVCFGCFDIGSKHRNKPNF